VLALQRETVWESDIVPGDLIQGHWDTPVRVVNRSTVVTTAGKRFLVRFVTDAGVMEVLPGSTITRLVESGS
jgi:hypothetical protein